MAQTDNTAIRDAFFGLLVLFGIFIVGSSLFDRFTGRSLNAEEKVLSIAVYPPALPDSQWGTPRHGLRLKLSFDTPAPSQFVDTTVQVQYENISDKIIAFLYDPNEILKSISAVNRHKWKLKLTPVFKDLMMSDDDYKKLYESSVQTLKPGEIFEGKIKCQIDNVVKDIGFTYGYFDAVCRLKIEKCEIPQGPSDIDPVLWTGRVKSGKCKIYLTMPHDGGCNDCHGDADYHHGVLQDCRFCHAESTNILEDSCEKCHKRDDQKIYGRRRVLGPDGDFDNPSKHIPGLIKDEDCLVCHNMTMHGMGTVNLVDPNSPGKIWTGSDTEYCLACHNSNPPEYVKFPEKHAASKAKGAKGRPAAPEPYTFPEFKPFSPDSNGYSEVQGSYPELETSGYPEVGTSGYPEVQRSYPETGTSGYPEVQRSYPETGTSGYPEVQRSYPETGTSGYPEVGTGTSGYPEVQRSYPETGTSGYPEVQNSHPESGASGYPDVMTEIQGNAGNGNATSGYPMLNPGEKIHSDTGVSIYDKSDFRNSVLYEKGVQCTDCHRSHGSNRHDLLKNIHGKDDKVRI